MKGLLLKEFYMARKHCKPYLLIIAAFIVFSIINTENLFFLFYPCLFCGMIPITLLSYDEHSKWHVYSGTLPYTKTELVSSKYIVGIILQGGILLFSAATQLISLMVNQTISLPDYLVLLAMQFILSTITISTSLPFMFKLGVEKGRAAYYVLIGFVCTGSVLASNIFSMNLQAEVSFNIALIILCLICIVLYVCSWRMSIAFYKKREIR